jgi:MGT family glycosyltransferase
VVVHDRAAFWGKLFAAKRAVNTIQVVPTFASNGHWAVTHKFAPIDTQAPEHKEYQAKLNALLTENGIGWDEIRTFERQIAFLPKAYQYRHETFGDETCFVGPCLRPAEGRWRPRDDRPVLLVSMGSLHTTQPGFHRRCLESFDDRWQVVMALGDGVDRESLGSVPGHFEVMPFVPQLDVLSHAKVFLSHGGMASTMEAVHFGVPLVQVPLTPEQEANVARVTELGLGERLDPAAEPAAVVERVACDDRIRSCLAVMREQTRNAGGAKAAADIIESGLARQG